MHHIFFCHGFSSFFEASAGRSHARSNPRVKRQSLFLAGEQPKRPTRSALRWRRATQGNKLRLLATVQEPSTRRPNLFLAVDGRFQTLVDKSLPDVLGRSNAHINGPGHVLVSPRRSLQTLVSQHQNRGTCDPMGRRFAGRSQLLKLAPLLGQQPYDVLLVALVRPAHALILLIDLTSDQWPYMATSEAHALRSTFGGSSLQESSLTVH